MTARRRGEIKRSHAHIVAATDMQKKPCWLVTTQQSEQWDQKFTTASGVRQQK